MTGYRRDFGLSWHKRIAAILGGALLLMLAAPTFDPVSVANAIPDTYQVHLFNTDDAMTRSEEELLVGKAQQETGRVRLRKYVVTEQVQTTVPVQREEVRVEREPVTEANREQALDGPEISEEEHEVVLHEEDPALSVNGVMHEGAVSAQLGLAGLPSISESTMVARDAAIARYELK